MLLNVLIFKKIMIVSDFTEQDPMGKNRRIFVEKCYAKSG
jgi:hypothetical protein